MNISRLRNHLTNFQFKELFVEDLGWEQPKDQLLGHISYDDKKIPYSKISEINGVPVLKFNQKNDSQNSKKFHKVVKKKYNKHLLLFSDDKSFFTLSYFSKKEQVRYHDWFKGQSGDYFINKLSSIHFGIEDEPKISDIGQKLEKAFNTEKITKKFYKDFKDNHFDLQKYIFGIQTEEEKKWYASLILNRLMFIWFLQTKGFINNDFDYLQTKLQESKKRGKDRYYSEFLTLLFFEGFAKKSIERSPKAKNLLGQIKYLNGGLFVPHSIEEKYEIKTSRKEYKTKIKIQDKAFDKTFKMFSHYEWCLEGKKGKSDKEISPDVMGYIFEKYINELQQKSLGAYYTRDEITSYLSRNTIQKCILEKVNKQGYKFENIAELLHKLDVPLCKRLLTDENSILNTLTVLDPAVGSGAFLTVAMKELVNIYSPIIGKIQTLGDRNLKNWLDDFEEKNKSHLYGIKKNIILKNLYGVDIMKEAVEVCKLRLFLSLVSYAFSKEELEPLPNMDFNILCGNSLIGFLKEEGINHSQPVSHSRESENPKQIPWSEILGESYDQIKDKYNKLVHRYKNKPLSFAQLRELKHKTNQFLKENNKKLNRVLADKCNKKGIKYPEILDIQGKKKKVQKRIVQPEDFYSEIAERNFNPLHWDFAFNEIINRGGFDIILTNPPWEKVKIEDREFFHKHDKSIDKKKTKKKVLKNKKEKLLRKPQIIEDYKKTEEFYLFQREYFSKLYQYQVGTINKRDGTEKQASADMDTYRLFTERSFRLLNKNGSIGIVLPSGLCKDDGAIGLRKGLLFSKAKIKSLIDFQNQIGKGKGKIFEGVHPQFKFLLLNLQKTKPQDEFPCQFHERDLSILDENRFPKNPKMKQSIKDIKKLSPRDCSIIEFKNPMDKNILKKTSVFPPIDKKLKNSWNPIIYTEFHETNDSHLFKDRKTLNNDLPLYKGSAIYQYEFNHDPSYVNRYVNKNTHKVKNGKGFTFKKQCYRNYRLVIRTIAGNTNERSLISAVIPKDCFISNNFVGVYVESNRSQLDSHLSLDKKDRKNDKNKMKTSVFSKLKSSKISRINKSNLSLKDKHSFKKQRDQHILDTVLEPESVQDQNHKYMFLLQAFFNSFIVDYFIRQKISSVINQKYLDSLHIPRLTEKDAYFKKLVELSAKLTCIGKEFDDLADEIGIPRGGITDKQERWKIQGEIDAIVAHIYGLNPKEFEHVLSTFTTGRNQERLLALKEYARQAFNKRPNRAS